MDTRRRRDTHDDGYTPELGTDTVPVELVELQQVGSSGGGLGHRALLGLTAIGVVAIVVIVANGRPANPLPSPSAPAVALASELPTAPTATPTTRPTIFRPTLAPPTPHPTPPPPWQWTRSDFLPDLNPSVEGAWGVNGTVLTLVRRIDPNEDRESWSIARLAESNAWELMPAPRAIIGLSAGTVIDGRLWFFAQVGGVTDADSTWRLVSTADGQTWASLGTAEGLPPFDGASFLARTNGTWMIVTQRSEGVGASNATISWSADGQHWKLADVPDLRANVGYTQVASIGGALVMLGFDFDTPENAASLVLRSTDGRIWRRSSFTPPSTSTPLELACHEGTCIVTLQPIAFGPSARQPIMVSTDGDHWTEVATNVSSTDENSSIWRVATTPTGFIAMTGSPAEALLSMDGVSWRTVEVLPPNTEDLISVLAVAGDVVVAMVPWQSSDEPNRAWIGSLAAMGK